MVLRTRPKNYYKASSKGDQLLARYAFKQRHGFAKSLLARTQRYNESVQFVRTASEQNIGGLPTRLKTYGGSTHQE
jgi:predicted patatin/cPLA2 family phospholipase